MCLILIAYRYQPGYPLLIAANRDEFYNRPTEPLAHWQNTPYLIAGRDIQGGGTWLGITTTGRFAALTNYRDPSRLTPNAPSRGQLVSDYLRCTEPARQYIDRVVERASLYNGFNLLLGDSEGLFYYANYEGRPRELKPGLYGLSNHFLDTPWPKVERARTALRQILEQCAEPMPEDLLGLLRDQKPAPDHHLPRTGIPLEWERWLSPIFITAPGYGTRASTALCVQDSGRVRLAEITWPEHSQRQFQIEWPPLKLGIGHSS